MSKLFLLSFLLVIGTVLFAQGVPSPINQEILGYGSTYEPEHFVLFQDGDETDFTFRTWIESRPDYVQSGPDKRYGAGVQYLSTGRLICYWNLANYMSVGAPVDWAQGEIVIIEVTQTSTGRIARDRFVIDTSSGPMIRYRDRDGGKAIILKDPPAVLFDSKTDTVTTTASLVGGYPIDGVYRATNWSKDKSWQISFSTKGVIDDLDLTSQLRRQFDDEEGTYGPKRFRTYYSINGGAEWIQHPVVNVTIPDNENWYDVNFKLPASCYGLDQVMVKWELFNASGTSDGWGDIKVVVKGIKGGAEPPLPDDQMAYDGTNYGLTIGGQQVGFNPTAGQPETVIVVVFSTDPNLPSVQLFPNPSALGAYFKFSFADPAVLSAGGELTLQFPNIPGQIWYRRGAAWKPIPWSLVVGPVAPNFTYTIDLTALFGRDGEGGDVEFAGDDGMGTLPVELSSFTGSLTANMFVELQWVSETESSMLGYNVYRSTEKDVTHAVQVTPSIIPASNSSVTTRYSFMDEDVELDQTYFYWLENVELDLTSSFHGPVAVTVTEGAKEVPGVFVTSLRGNFPNPFNPETTIHYSLESKEQVEIKIYNVRGQLVKTLVSGEMDKGDYKVVWNGKTDSGKAATSGIYFYQMSTPSYSKIQKMMLLK